MKGSCYCRKHPPRRAKSYYSPQSCWSILSFVFLLVGYWSSFEVLVCSALILGTNKNRKSNFDIPNLATLAPKLSGTKLNFRIAVGDPENPFPIQGLHVELGRQQRTTKRSSTGIHDADLLDKPFYINDKGMQTVQFDQGGWEVTWRRNSPHGHFICSLVNPECLQRNEDKADNDDDNSSNNSVLPAGRFFLYHRVWTAATLESERERRRGLQAQAAAYLQERDAQLEKIMTPAEEDKNNNALSKMMSYGQAAKSMNQFRTLGLKEAQFIPLFDDQVLELATSPDCIVSTRGRIFAVRENRRRKPEYIGESRVDFFIKD